MRLVVADGRSLVLHGAQLALARSEEIEVVAAVDNGSRVLPVVAQTRPDAVLLGTGLPQVDARRCLDLLVERHPEVDVVVLAASIEQDEVEAAFRAGARGYVFGGIEAAELAAAIVLALAGTARRAIGLPARDEPRSEDGLTPRELDVLAGVGRGLSNGQIARDLWITEKTVKFHLHNIYRKLNVSNRVQAARHANRYGFRDEATAVSAGRSR